MRVFLKTQTFFKFKSHYINIIQRSRLVILFIVCELILVIKLFTHTCNLYAQLAEKGASSLRHITNTKSTII